MADEPAQASNDQQPQAGNDRQLLLQKIYIKDMSFESPKAPEVFTLQRKANTQLNIGSGKRQIDGNHYEVTLTLTIESKDGDQTLFLIEIVQAGVFTISGYTDQERAALIGSFCPGTLYPFAREAVAEIASKGGFPQLLLQPINFDALYAQALQQRQADAGAGQPLQVQMPGAAPADAAAAGISTVGAGKSSDGGAPGGGDTH
jgi:preprotein translocase subunit SecB